MRKAQIAVIVALWLVFAIAAAFLLLTPDARRSGTNSVSPDSFFVNVGKQSPPLCINALALPANTAGIRLMLGTYRRPGPQTTMTLRNVAGKAIGRDSHAGYADGHLITFKVPPAASSTAGNSACFRVAGPVAFAGSVNGNADPVSSVTVGNKPGPGDMSIEFMQPGKHSLASQFGTIADRASLFRPSWVGPWTFYVAFLLALFVLGAGTWLLLRLSSFRPTGSKRWLIAVALIAFANAAIWSVITPAFNVPDELAHYAYVETLAHGELPDKAVGKEGGNSYLPSTVLASAQTATTVIQRPFAKPPWTKAQEAKFFKDYDAVSDGPDRAYGLTPANAYSPLYYAPAVVPYELASSGSVFDQLWLVRLYSALLCALAVLFIGLFARELVPSVSWFGPVAALAVAFEPMFVHMGGGVSNDNLLTVFAAATLYLGARMLRRGPSTKLAVATGVAFALGVFAKPTIVGLLPALLLVLLVAALRDRENRGVNVRRLAIGVGALVAIVVVGAALFGIGGGTGASLASGSGGKQPVTLTGLINFTWQWYLPAIPGTGQFFVGVPPFFGTFVRGFVGNFNSLDTPFPNWLYALATVVGVVLVGGAIAAVYQRRDRLRSQWPLVAYPLLAIVGVAAFVNLTTYLVLVHDGTPFAQGRYLFPAIGVFGLLVAAGSLGFGRRRGLVVATAVVLSLGMLDVLGMGLSMARFYV